MHWVTLVNTAGLIQNDLQSPGFYVNDLFGDLIITISNVKRKNTIKYKENVKIKKKKNPDVYW